MKKLVLFFVFINSVLNSQETLSPEKSVSFGLNNHTNRDEAFFTNIDNELNTILVGTTERDSTFTDILTTKLDLNYNFIWQKRFSLPTNLSYDLPLKSFINSNNDIFIIGRSSFIQSSRNGLIFIIKYNKDGNIVYQKNIGNIDGSDYTDFTQFEILLNDDDSINLFYQTNYYHQDNNGNQTGERTSTFNLLRIDSLGNTISSINYEAEYTEFKSVIKNNILYVLIKKENSDNTYNFHLYKLSFLENNINIFDITDENFVNFMNYADLEFKTKITVLNNSLYINSFNNNGYSQIKDQILFSKFNLDGVLSYSFVSSENKKYFFLGSFIKEGEEKINFLVNNLESDLLQSLTVENNNQIIEFDVMNNLGTGFKINNDNSFFITTNNSSIKLFSSDLLELNSFTTSNTYNLIDFSKIDNNSITSFGIIFNKMYPESNYYTQLDQIAEKINVESIEKNYVFSGEGTSKSFQQTIYIDNNNNYIVLSAEKLGPECNGAGCNNAPFGNRIIKYDSNLNIIWELDLTEDSYNITSSYNFKNNVKIDSNNNIYLSLKNKERSKSFLYKVNPNGIIEYKKEVVHSKEIVINENANKIYVISGVLTYTDQTTWQTNNWTEIATFKLSDGELITSKIYDFLKHYNHFIYNDSLHTYFINNGVGSNYTDEYFLSLYNEENQLYERKLNLLKPGYLSPFKSIIKNDGTLIFTSQHSGLSQYRKFHKINRLNEYTNYPTDYHYRDLFLFNNKILTFEDNSKTLKTFNETFNEINSFQIDDTYQLYYNFFNDKVLLQANNKVIFLNQNLNIINEYKLPYLFEWNYNFDNYQNLIIVNNFGKSIYFNPHYSWLRGRVSKYNINSILNLNSFNNNKNNIKIYPNPSKGEYIIDIENLKKIDVYDINGKYFKSFYSKKIDIIKFKKGIYLLKIYTLKNIFNFKILKN